MGIASIMGIIVLAVLILGSVLVIFSRYRIANSNQVLVITGKVSGNKSAKTIHGGATFVWPVFQQYFYLDLSPMNIDINLRNALSKQNIRIDVPSSFTIAIGTEPPLMGAAAERLLGKEKNTIADMAGEIIFGQLRATIADMTIEEINKDREKFIKNVRDNVEGELKKIGLIVLNVNITDIRDESGYLEALGQKAASEAINQAKVDVAEKDRDGEIGSANAKKEERIQVSSANSAAVQGENEASILIAASNAELKVKEEEAKKRETSATLVNKSKAEKEGYDAQKITEDARALQEEARLKAEIVVPAEIAKKEVEINAEADKKKEELAGEAKGNATKAELVGEAEGLKAILEAKASGFKQIVEAAGGSAEDAAKLLIIEQLPEIAKIQVEAIKNIKIDKITVWDSGQGGGKDGQGGSTSNFLQSMMGFVPPMNEMLNNAGMQLPGWIGETFDNQEEKVLPNQNTVVEEVETKEVKKETTES